MLEKIKGYRTVIFNVSIAVLAVLYGEDVVVAAQNVDISSEETLAVVSTLIAAVNVFLRVITKTPIGKQQPEEPKA